MIQPTILKRDSLRVRLTLVFIGLAIIPLLLAGGALTLQSYTVQQEQVLFFQRHLVEHVVTHIVSFVENLESELRLVNQIQPLTRLTPEQQRDTLSRVQAQEHILRELCLLDKQGQEQVRVTRFGDVTEQDLGNRADTDAFTVPMETGATYYGPVWIDTETGEPVMTIAVPVIEPRTGEPDGVLAADIRFKQVWDFISNIPRSGNESVFLVDEQGNVIAHHNPSIVLRGTNFLIPEQDGMQIGLEGERVILIVNQFQLGAQEFFVIAEQPVSEALALPRQALIITGGFLVITLLVVVILGSLAIRQIVQPVQGLALVAQEIEAGDLSRRALVTSKDEIGILGGAFNSMAAQLQTTVDELEQRVMERTAQLEAANQELEAFSYSVSHDLRAPLRAINGYTQILAEDYASDLDAEGQQLCAAVQNATRRMNHLIDDLLAFSRLSQIDIQSSLVDMTALVKMVNEELTASKNCERFEFQIESLPPALGDSTMLRQVWSNLLSNAYKFSAKRERAIITVGGSQGDDANLYYVRDNGAGFDMQFADKLFSVFQRLHSDREFEGTGVGLAIVQRVIRRHGGRVWAEGEVNRGATFYFTLPRKEIL